MMQTLVLTFLILDVVLIFVVFQKLKQASPIRGSLAEIIEERKIIKELAQELKQDASQCLAHNKSTLEQIKLIAAQVEMDLKKNPDTLKEQTQKAFDELVRQLDAPIHEVIAQKNSLQNIMHKIEADRKTLSIVLAQAEKLKQFFAHNTTYQKLIESIDIEKYSDVRRLLAQGMPLERVAENMGLLVDDVRMIRDMTLS